MGDLESEEGVQQSKFTYSSGSQAKDTHLGSSVSPGSQQSQAGSPTRAPFQICCERCK